jgi:hypothetical protein
MSVRMPTKLCIRGIRMMSVALLCGTADKCYQQLAHSLSISTSSLPLHFSTGTSTQGMYMCKNKNTSDVILILELSVCGNYGSYLI